MLAALPSARRAGVALLLAGLAAPVAAAVTVQATQALSFGAVVPGSAAGTVAMSPLGNRTWSGGVVLFTQGPNAAGQPAIFTITGGTANAECAITLPQDDEVNISGPGGTDMKLDDIVSLPASSIVLDVSGGGTVRVGATLKVGAAQVPGVYETTLGLTLGLDCTDPD